MAQQGPGEYTDVESLLKCSAERMYEQLKPKLEAGSKVRDLLEDRAMGFTERAKQFVLEELNSTATGLLKAIEAEEATLLLDFNNAVDASFPPVPVLMAGLLSPSILAVSMLSHILQLCLLFGPIAIFSGWAVYTDMGAVCGIPTMISWNYVAFFLSFFLTLGHLCIAVQINSGKAQLKLKSEEISARLAANAADGETDLLDMQEIFIGSSILVQQALLIEDSIRRSFWHHIIGSFTLLWLFTTIWNWVIVIGWTFVPGTIAFHEKAHSVAGGDFCGAWASVFTARIVCILVPMFFFINLLQVVDWITKSLINSKGFADTMIGIAKDADAGMMGLPVVEYLIKAFVLRGSTDTLQAKLTVALSERVRLQREHGEVCDKLAALESKIKVSKKGAKKLEKTAKDLGGTRFDGMLNQLKRVQDKGDEEWKAEGMKLVEEATAEMGVVKEAATEELDKVAKWIMEIVDKIQNSDFVAEAIEQAKAAKEMAQKAAEEGAKKAQEMAEQLPDREQMEAYAAQAQEAAGQAAAQAQVAAQAGMVQAQAAAAQAQEMATPLLAEAKAQGEVLAAQAQEQGKALAAQAQEQGKALASQAQEQGKKALSEAQKAADKAKDKMKK